MQCLAHGRCSLYVDSFLLEFTLFTMQHSLRNSLGPWPWDHGTATPGLGKLGKLGL